MAYLTSVHGTLEVEDVLNSKRILKTYKFDDPLEGNLFVEKINAWLLREAEKPIPTYKTEKEKVNDFGINTLVNGLRP